MAGFVYVLSNPAYGNRLKIGKSAIDPEERRAAELYNTSAPEPFVLEYYAFVDDFDRVEVLVHQELANYRPNAGREFFTVSVPDAIRAIRRHSKKIHFERDPRQQRIAVEAEERRRAAESRALEMEQKRLQAQDEIRHAVAAKIPKLKEEVEKLGNQTIDTVFREIYPEPSGWTTLLMILIFPLWPVLFFRWRSYQHRYQSIYNSYYENLKANTLSKLDQLSLSADSEDWDTKLDNEYREIKNDFLGRVRQHAENWKRQRLNTFSNAWIDD